MNERTESSGTAEREPLGEGEAGLSPLSLAAGRGLWPQPRKLPCCASVPQSLSLEARWVPDGRHHALRV